MFYRIRQFLLGLTAKMTENDHIFIDKFLNSKEKELFYRLRSSEQKHSVNVAYGCFKELNNNTLTRAALLHDIGKVKSNLTLVNKALVVLSMKFNINSKILPSFLRQALYFKAHHPEIGFEILNEFIEDEKMLSLVRYHHNPEKYKTLEMDVLIKYDNLY
ncbi:HD domain-containing protein [Serpentinicella sp. ANB-PHB4]|uniref:HD domain-containing protein n=1 Tax=Serpentinicella sp. ANB-PHB4 TaxID=3074076 RepID=UPI002859BA1A|nr:HD domain-containing protein [Serpentinicella sp. ANB-PHB4]MDR5658528.1 HD domain-containing protein [Serpentinicella sp. ANB-PHB4]